MEKKNVRKKMITWQIVYGVLTVIGAFPGLLMLAFSSDNVAPTLLFKLEAYSYPIFVLTFLLSSIASWNFFAKGKYRGVMWLNMLLSLSFLWFILSLVYMA
ncbi:hypothetical protein [Gottfriedia acidiceleris]|uniref:hypothetical protein n=1 Tax=Gottfriedia acidiceleris TaxID=371036 RepID=UPI003D25294C